MLWDLKYTRKGLAATLTVHEMGIDMLNDGLDKNSNEVIFQKSIMIKYHEKMIEETQKTLDEIKSNLSDSS